MTEYFWKIKNDDKTSLVEWDSVSKSLIAPALVSPKANNLVRAGEIVWLTPVGPKFMASLDDSLPAYATIVYAIEAAGLKIVDFSLCPIDPEQGLELGEGGGSGEIKD